MTDEKILAKITKFPLQWKVIFEFNPREPLERENRIRRNILSIKEHSAFLPKAGSTNRWFIDLDYNGSINLQFPPCKGRIYGGRLESDQLLRTPAWSRVEITHEEEEDGKYFLSLSVNALWGSCNGEIRLGIFHF